jgi:hypothetical protein
MTKTSGEPITAYENFDNTASERAGRAKWRMGEWAKRRMARAEFGPAGPMGLMGLCDLP